MVVNECEVMFPSSIGYEPWLMLLHGQNKDMQELINPYNHRIEERKIPQLEGKLCLGCFGEWLLLSQKLTKETFFLNLLDPKRTVRLPSFGRGSPEYCCSCVVSDIPTSRNCMVTFVGRRRNCILYCRPNMDTSWSEVSISIDSEGNNNGFSSGQVVRSNGKIYALHQCGLERRVVVIDESSLLNGGATWTTVDLPDAIGSSHLVVSGKAIFLVSVVLSCYRGNPTDCTVHLLETSDLSWKRVKSIGGRVFFLGGIQSAALPATQAGLQRDCIFIVNVKHILFPDEGIYRICLQDQTVSLSLLLEWPKDAIWYEICWVMPTRSRKSNRRALSLSHAIGTNMGHSTYVHKEEKKEGSCKIDNSRTWADMPIELVQLLLPRLYLVECLRLTSLCKAWNSLSNLVQNAMANPWLIYCANECSSWRVFDPVSEKEYSIDTTWLGFTEDLTFHYSKDGWVLASKEDNSLFLINPLTRECVSLPKSNFCCRREPLAFSSAPTSPDCVVVIAEFIDDDIVKISTWSPSEEQWSAMSFHDELGYIVPCNPVFTRGEFYWYRLRGELIVFNPFKKTWRVLEIKAPIEMLHGRSVMECHLVESGADLITVFKGVTTEPIRIFKLERLHMVWSELHDMGNVTIFLDRRTTIATSCPQEWCHNRIYLSGFSDNKHIKSSAFYSWETTEYYPKVCSDLKEHMNCIWIEPNLTA